MKATANSGKPTLQSVTLELSPLETQRLVGLLGETYGSDGDGLFEPLNKILSDFGLRPAQPKHTKLIPADR